MSPSPASRLSLSGENRTSRRLIGTMLRAWPMVLALAAAPVEAGKVTVTGAEGKNGAAGTKHSPDGKPGSAGKAATAATTTPANASNTATATGGAGGSGGNGYSDGGDGGAGASGGDASATATTTLTGGAASATVTGNVDLTVSFQLTSAKPEGIGISYALADAAGSSDVRAGPSLGGRLEINPRSEAGLITGSIHGSDLPAVLERFNASYSSAPRDAVPAIATWSARDRAAGRLRELMRDRR